MWKKKWAGGLCFRNRKNKPSVKPIRNTQYAKKPKSDVMILVHAAAAKNIKSATASTFNTDTHFLPTNRRRKTTDIRKQN